MPLSYLIDDFSMTAINAPPPNFMDSSLNLLYNGDFSIGSLDQSDFYLAGWQWGTDGNFEQRLAKIYTQYEAYYAYFGK